jgi:hypothetical protein
MVKATAPVADNAKIEIKVTLERADNTKKEITNLEVKAGATAVMQGSFTHLYWGALELKFESKIEKFGAAKNFKEQPAKIILTNKTGRELAVDELKVLTLHYTATAQIHNTNGDINNKTLEALGKATAAVANDGKIEIEVTLVRKENKEKQITDVVVKSAGTVVMQGTPGKLDWKAVPKVTLTSASGGQVINCKATETSAQFIVKSTEAISEELAKEIKVKFELDSSSSGKLNFNTKTIDNMTLFELLGDKGLDTTEATVKIDLEDFKSPRTNGRIFLEGPIELENVLGLSKIS